MTRVRFMEHRGAQILYIDVSNCGIDEIFETMRDALNRRSAPSRRDQC
jgi:hypothetical protein